MQDLKNKIAVISGAGSGFGKATAALFCEQGARVVGIGRSEHNLLKAKEEIGEIDCLGCDRTQRDNRTEHRDHRSNHRVESQQCRLWKQDICGPDEKARKWNDYQYFFSLCN
jgi:NAD(P)-dependent dehydrogenase (short-subunit alcohol dehydrogenase family)